MNILCYGNSNTWGFPPGGGPRFDTDTRWPAVMASCLGPGYTVIEEGLNGRTIGNFMPPGHPGNGLEYLERLLPKHPRLDLILLSLGINDLFRRTDIGAEEIARNVGQAVELIQSGEAGSNWSRPTGPNVVSAPKPPKVILLSPLPINIDAETASFYRLQRIKSESLADEYRKVAELYGVSFVDTGTIISASPEDGVHIDAAGHRTLGNELCKLI